MSGRVKWRGLHELLPVDAGVLRGGENENCFDNRWN